MRAAVLLPGGGFALREMPKPAPAPGECLLRVRACGVCTSDMGAWREGLGRETVLGHEIVATVEACGAGVNNIKPGQRVTGCILGGYAEYTTAPASALLAVPDGLSDAEAIVEPFVCLISALRRLPPPKEKPVAVLGAGYMGLALIRLLRLEGAGRVTAIDLQPALLKKAREMGANETLTPEQAEGREFPLVLEAAGSQSALDAAALLTRRYGVLGIIGYHPCVRQVDMRVWAGKAMDVVNVFEYRRPNQLAYMAEALASAGAGSLGCAELITHRFPLSQLTKAFELHSQKPPGYYKSMIDDFIQ